MPLAPCFRYGPAVATPLLLEGFLRWLAAEDSPAGLGPEHPRDGGRDPPPFALLARELLPPLFRQRVEARAPVAVGGPPLRVDEAARLEALQRGIERPVIDDEDVVGLLLDDPGDPLPVLRAEDERPEDEQVERALQMRAVLAVHSFSNRHSTQVSLTWVECQHVEAKTRGRGLHQRDSG